MSNHEEVVRMLQEIRRESDSIERDLARLRDYQDALLAERLLRHAWKASRVRRRALRHGLC